MGRCCSVHDTPQFDCIDCRRTARIRQAAADGRIELASTVLWWMRWSHTLSWC